jgi:hypothetical protein
MEINLYYLMLKYPGRSRYTRFGDSPKVSDTFFFESEESAIEKAQELIERYPYITVKIVRDASAMILSGLNSEEGDEDYESNI